MVSGNDYLIQVKGNQKKLANAIKENVQVSERVDIQCTKDKVRGRDEYREYHIYQGMQRGVFSLWQGLYTIILVRRISTRGGKRSEEWSTYISSRKEKLASTFSTEIRTHWFIENKLHWVKDKIQGEDKSLINCKSLALNMSMMRTFVYNIFKLNHEDSILYAVEKYTNRISECIKAINMEYSNILKN